MREKLYMMWLVWRSSSCCVIGIRDGERTVAVSMDVEEVIKAADHIREVGEGMTNVDEANNIVNNVDTNGN